MTRTLLLFPLALGVFAQSQPVRQVTSQATLFGNQLIPGFQNGYLYFLEGGSIRLYSPEGLPVLTTELRIPDTSQQASAIGLAVDTDGSVAVSTGYLTSAGNRGGIAFFDSHGQPAGFVDTGRYMPGNLCFGEDHSLWTFGWQMDALQPDHPDSKEYMLVHNYSPDHREHGRYLPRSLFPKGLETGSQRWQSLRIAVAHDRVGLFASSGMKSSQNEWVELDLKGSLIRRVRLDAIQSQVKLAFTADGRLYRQIHRQPNLQVLDRTTPEWADAGPAPGNLLWGADGNSLVFSPSYYGKEGPIVLEWFEQPAAISPRILSGGQQDD